MTGNATPVQIFGCPANTDVTNEKNDFAAGETIYFTSFFRDELNGMMTSYRVYRPDGSLWVNWNRTAPATYNYGSWWWKSYTLPVDAPDGVWRYELTFNGETETHLFSVDGPCLNNPVLTGDYSGGVATIKSSGSDH